jgi:hypothetical protein
MTYRIHHRWDERGVVVESGVFDDEGEVPEGFTTEGPVVPSTAGTAVRVPVPVFEPKPLVPWSEEESPSPMQVQIDEQNFGFVDEDDVEPEVEGSPMVVGDPPPHGGAGSGREAWAKYAEDNGVEVSDEDERADIIEKVESAGIPT